MVIMVHRGSELYRSDFPKWKTSPALFADDCILFVKPTNCISSLFSQYSTILFFLRHIILNIFMESYPFFDTLHVYVLKFKMCCIFNPEQFYLT